MRGQRAAERGLWRDCQRRCAHSSSGVRVQAFEESAGPGQRAGQRLPGAPAPPPAQAPGRAPLSQARSGRTRFPKEKSIYMSSGNTASGHRGPSQTLLATGRLAGRLLCGARPATQPGGCAVRGLRSPGLQSLRPPQGRPPRPCPRQKMGQKNHVSTDPFPLQTHGRKRRTGARPGRPGRLRQARGHRAAEGLRTQ